MTGARILENKYGISPIQIKFQLPNKLNKYPRTRVSPDIITFSISLEANRVSFFASYNCTCSIGDVGLIIDQISGGL